jgi:hypothetical protein
MEMISKREAIQRVRKQAAIDIARTIVRYPGPVGLVMALRINACARGHARAIAAYTEPKPGEVVDIRGPVMRADG